MIASLWEATVHGGIALVTDAAIITSPRFGDGSWRGGWWGKYDRPTGKTAGGESIVAERNSPT